MVEGNVTAFWLKLKYSVEDGGCVHPLKEINFQHELHLASFLSLDHFVQSTVGWQISFILKLHKTINVCASVI